MANIEALRVVTYSNSLEMLSQQMTANLAPYCRIETATPGQKSHRMLSQIQSMTVGLRTSRAEQIDNSEVNYDGRWVYRKPYHSAVVVDDIDLQQMNLDPTNAIVQSQVAAMNRQMDTDFLAAFFGTSQTGETGGTSTSFTAGNQIAETVGAAAATGLNVAKMRAALKVLRENEVDTDFEPVFMGVTPKLHDDLLALTEVKSTDFNPQAVLVDGKVTRFLGINIVISNRVDENLDGSGYIRVPLWVPSGIGCAYWQRLTGRIQEVPSMKGSPKKIEAEAAFGFTRLEEAKCIEIKCTT